MQNKKSFLSFHTIPVPCTDISMYGTCSFMNDGEAEDARAEHTSQTETGRTEQNIKPFNLPVLPDTGTSTYHHSSL